jgi:excisionase family DNA binding protein
MTTTQPRETAHPPEATEEPLTLTISKTAKRVGVSRETIRGMLARGALGYVTLPGGARRIPTAEITHWLRVSTVRGEA